MELSPEQRDEQIFREHFAAFRITTYSALTRLFFKTTNAARKAVGRWRDRDLVTSAALTPARQPTGDRDYFRVTKKAIRTYQLDARLARSPGPTALAEAYAILTFCCLGTERYHKATAAEFRERFPSLVDERLQNDYYYRDHDFMHNGHPRAVRIGYLYRDTGTSVRRITERVGEIVAQRRSLRAWRDEVLDRDRFIIAVVTMSRGKKRQIEEALDLQNPLFPYRVEVYEALRHLIPEPRRHATSRSNNA